MSNVSLDDVKKLAALSALHVRDDDVATMQHDLGSILDFVEQLNAVPTTGVEPTYQVIQQVSVLRDDVIMDYGVTNEALLASAPHHSAQTIVPRVLE